MADLATLQTRLDSNEVILASDVATMTKDGETVTYDLERDRARIERQVAQLQGSNPSIHRIRREGDGVMSCNPASMSYE